MRQMTTDSRIINFNNVLAWIIITTGFCLGTFFLSSIIYALISPDFPLDPEIIGALIFIALLFGFAVFMFLAGINLEKRCKRARIYGEMIEKKNSIPLTEIAAATGRSPEYIVKDIKAMIYAHLLVNVNLNTEKSEIILVDNRQATAVSKQQLPAKADIVLIKLQCPNCGADNEGANGTVIYCQYCHTRLFVGKKQN